MLYVLPGHHVITNGSQGKGALVVSHETEPLPSCTSSNDSSPRSECDQTVLLLPPLAPTETLESMCQRAKFSKVFSKVRICSRVSLT